MNETGGTSGTTDLISVLMSPFSSILSSGEVENLFLEKKPLCLCTAATATFSSAVLGLDSAIRSTVQWKVRSEKECFQDSLETEDIYGAQLIRVSPSV